MSLTRTPGNPQVDALRNRVALGGTGGGATGATGPGGPGVGPVTAFDSSGLIPVNFTTIPQAIAYASAHGISNYALVLAPGVYPDPIVVPEATFLTIQGFVSGQATLGPISWSTAGGLLVSALVLRNLNTPEIDISDGSSPATLAVLVLENVTVSDLFIAGSGKITQTGTSTIQVQISGLSSSEQSLSGLIVSSQIQNGIASTGTFDLSTDNTVYGGPVAVSLLFSSGAQFDGDVTIRGAEAEMVTGRIGAITITFAGASGILSLDTVPHYWFITNGATLVNGSIVSLGAVVINKTVEATVGTISAGNLATIVLPVAGVQNARAVVVTPPQSFTDANVGLFLPTISSGMVSVLALNFTGSDFTPGDPVPFQVAITY